MTPWRRNVDFSKPQVRVPFLQVPDVLFMIRMIRIVQLTM